MHWSCVLISWVLLGGEDTAPSPIDVYVTTFKLEKRLQREPSAAWGATPRPEDVVVSVDPSKSLQNILGMGSSLEPTTCFNIAQFDTEVQENVVEKLVHPDRGIGMNLMRVCIGTPDFTGDPWYTYDDLPTGETDLNLDRFSIEKDRAYILPVIKLVAKANPDCLFFASPWSPPGWMKTTGNMIGGRIKKEWFATYARYFVRFIQAYQTEGVPIYAVTVQNEPGVDRNLEKDQKWWYPSCRWSAEDERDFIRDHLGPAFAAANLSTKIWCYDHNFNTTATPDGDDPGLDYPRLILRDPKAARLVAGVALHGYAGKPENMSLLHQEFPDVPIHFTEGSVFGLLGAARLVALLRNHATSYNAWVTMSDTKGKPNNGPFSADTTAVQRDVATNAPIFNFDYYMLGHFTRFIPRGAVRVDSESTRLPNVAFRATDETIRLVLVNSQARERSVRIESQGRSARLPLPGACVMTLLWTP